MDETLWELENLLYLVGQAGIAVGVVSIALRQPGSFAWLAAAAGVLAALLQGLLSLTGSELASSLTGMSLLEGWIGAFGIGVGASNLAMGLFLLLHSATSEPGGDRRTRMRPS